MNGKAIGAQPLAEAGLRDLPSEYFGPRPGGVRSAETDRRTDEARTARVTRR